MSRLLALLGRLLAGAAVPAAEREAFDVAAAEARAEKARTAAEKAATAPAAARRELEDAVAAYDASGTEADGARVTAARTALDRAERLDAAARAAVGAAQAELGRVRLAAAFLSARVEEQEAAGAVTEAGERFASRVDAALAVLELVTRAGEDLDAARAQLAEARSRSDAARRALAPADPALAAEAPRSSPAPTFGETREAAERFALAATAIVKVGDRCAARVDQVVADQRQAAVDVDAPLVPELAGKVVLERAGYTGLAAPKNPDTATVRHINALVLGRENDDSANAAGSWYGGDDPGRVVELLLSAPIDEVRTQLFPTPAPSGRSPRGIVV